MISPDETMPALTHCPACQTEVLIPTGVDDLTWLSCPQCEHRFVQTDCQLRQIAELLIARERDAQRATGEDAWNAAVVVDEPSYVSAAGFTAPPGMRGSDPSVV